MSRGSRQCRQGNITLEQANRILTFSKTTCVDLQPHKGIGGVINAIWHLKASNEQQYILKICNAFPRWKHRKAMNEVASCLLMQKRCPHIPVPTIIDFFTGVEKEKDVLEGREWILMTKIMESVNVEEVWVKGTDAQRHYIMEQLADVLESMYQVQFPAIGCFSLGDKREIELAANVDTGVPPTPSTTMHWAGELQQYIPLIADCEKWSYLASGLTKFIQNVLPQWAETYKGPFVLNHIDLQPTNLLIDKESWKLEGIVDWEWCMASPEDDYMQVLGDVLNEKESATMQMLLKERGILPSPGFDERSKIRKVIEQAMTLGCYEDWLSDDPSAEEKERADAWALRTSREMAIFLLEHKCLEESREE